MLKIFRQSKLCKKVFDGLDVFKVLIAGLLSVAGVYELHRLTNGGIITSRLLTAVTLLFFLSVFSLRAFPWMKIKTERLKNNDWIIISVLSSLLVVWVWAGRPIFGGDYLVHHQYVMQLKNGFKYAHDFYNGYPGYYPPLSHSLIAVLSNVSGLSVHHSFLILTLAIAVMTPYVSYHISQQAGFSRMTSFLFAALISVYGGFGLVRWNMSHLYLPAIQLTMPFVSRNAGFLIFLVYLLFWSRIFNHDARSGGLYGAAGILAGMLAITHPQPFIIALLLLVFIFFEEIRKRENVRYILFSLSLCMIIASLFYIPLLMNLFHWKAMRSGLEKFVIYPTEPLIYGPVAVLAAFSLFNSSAKGRKWISLCFIYVTAMLFVLALTAVFDGFEGMFRVFRFHKFGAISFVFLTFLASYGFESAFFRRKKIMSVLIVAAFLAVGLYSNMSYINLWYKGKIRTVVKILSGKRALFPDGKADSYEDLRLRIADTRKTVFVPASPAGLSKRIAFYLGLDVPYVDKGLKLAYRDFLSKTISQDKRRRLVDDFYVDLQRGVLRYDTLKIFNSDMFFAKQRDLDEKHGVNSIGSIKFGEDSWYLYNITRR
jgi:hypothetical protein